MWDDGSTVCLVSSLPSHMRLITCLGGISRGRQLHYIIPGLDTGQDPPPIHITHPHLAGHLPPDLSTPFHELVKHIHGHFPRSITWSPLDWYMLHRSAATTAAFLRQRSSEVTSVAGDDRQGVHFNYWSRCVQSRPIGVRLPRRRVSHEAGDG